MNGFIRQGINKNVKKTTNIEPHVTDFWLVAYIILGLSL